MFLKTTSDLLNSSTTNGTYLGTESISNENGVTVHPILKFTHFVHLKMIFDLLCQMLQHIYSSVKKFSRVTPSLLSRLKTPGVLAAWSGSNSSNTHWIKRRQREKQLGIRRQFFSLESGSFCTRGPGGSLSWAAACSRWRVQVVGEGSRDPSCHPACSPE